MKKKKNIIIGILIAVIALMGVGYAALAQVLTINGTANVAGTWDVRITGIVPNGSVGASNTNNVAPSYTATSATFAVDLEYPGAWAEYEVTIENRGTINAELSSITGLDLANLAAPTDIIFIFCDGSECMYSEDEIDNAIAYELENEYFTYHIEPGEEKNYWITVGWNPDSTSIPSVTTKSATINLNFVQTDRINTSNDIL